MKLFQGLALCALLGSTVVSLPAAAGTLVNIPQAQCVRAYYDSLDGSPLSRVFTFAYDEVTCTAVVDPS